MWCGWLAFFEGVNVERVMRVFSSQHRSAERVVRKRVFTFAPTLFGQLMYLSYLSLPVYGLTHDLVDGRGWAEGRNSAAMTSSFKTLIGRNEPRSV